MHWWATQPAPGVAVWLLEPTCRPRRYVSVYVERLAAVGTTRYHRLELNPSGIVSTGTPSGDAVVALARAARAARLRHPTTGGPWPLVNVLASGQLLGAGGTISI